MKLRERLAQLPTEVVDQWVIHKLAERYKKSLYLTSKILLNYKDITPRTHGSMVSALESPNSRKLIVMPRGAFKSSIGVVAYSIWLLMRDPNERILIDSEVYSNSKNFLREIKAQLKEERFIRLFGNWEGESWTEGEITIAPRNKAYKEASITCGGIETVKVGQHYSTIVGDDYNSGNNSQTEEGRQKIIRHYRMNQSILDPGGKYVIIGTRYSQSDLIGWIMDNELPKGLLPKV
jgi:hypothetical protein